MALADPLAGETLDSICGGLQILQRTKGYRFNLDSILLARFALEGLPADRPLKVIDLGTGSGVVAMLLARWCPEWKVTGVEVQEAVAERARRNAALNQLPVEITTADWRTLGTPGRAGDADLVVCNPPYFTADGGEPCADEERAAARQELNGTLDETLRAAARLVRGNGSVRFVHTAARLPDLLSAVAAAGLGVVRLAFIHPRANEEAGAVLLEALPGARRPTRIDPPIFVHSDTGGFLPQIGRLLAGEGL
jgi:tRNA1(Val) A37 N6-methylase TrmN6